jgi:hypothetical protein
MTLINIIYIYMLQVEGILECIDAEVSCVYGFCISLFIATVENV